MEHAITKSIEFDFEKETVRIVQEGITGVNELIIPGLKEREMDILLAAGLQITPASELRNDINKIFEELGVNVEVE